MTESEKLVHASLIAEGWTVLRNGWPDFLCFRNKEFKAVEVKHGMDVVHPNQKANHRVLRLMGLDVQVVYPCGKGKLKRPDVQFRFRSEWQFSKAKEIARKAGISVNELILRSIEQGKGANEV